MSTMLLVALVLLVAAIQLRVALRARATVRLWAREWGYRILSIRFESAFDGRYRTAGQPADLVYRLVVENEAGDRLEGRALLGIRLFGRNDLEVRWNEPSRRDAG